MSEKVTLHHAVLHAGKEASDCKDCPCISNVYNHCYLIRFDHVLAKVCQILVEKGEDGKKGKRKKMVDLKGSYSTDPIN